MSKYMCTNCHENAQYYIIFGCFNMHLDARAFCQKHSAEWAAHEIRRELHCMHPGCGEPIQEYEYTDPAKVVI